MKKSLINYRTYSVLFLLASFTLLTSVLKAQDGFVIKNDTLKAEEHGFFSIPEIDYEIEKITRYLDKTSKQIKALNNQLDNDTSYLALLRQIERESIRFNSYEPENLSKFFLENSQRVWSSYKNGLIDIRNVSYELLNKSEERNQLLEKQEKTWKKTAENSRKHQIPKIQTTKIREIQKRINKQHNDNYKISLRILNNETNIHNQFNFVESTLNEINVLLNQYRSELFNKTNPAIWNIDLAGSTNRDLKEGLKLAWNDNTKHIIHNYSGYASRIQLFIFISLLLILLHFFLRKAYLKKFGDVRKTRSGDIKYITIENPISSVLGTISLTFFVIFENLPLALTGVITIFMLICVFMAMRIYLNANGNTLLKKFSILLLLNLSEIVIWYLGDYSRIFLFIETSIGIYFIYPYITKKFAEQELNQLRFSKIVNLLRFPLFFIFITSFLANIAGYVYLTIFLQKIAIHFSVITILILGMWHIVISYVQLFADIITRSNRMRLNTYMPLFKKRIILFFQLFFGYILFNTILNLFELRSQFYEGLENFMQQSRQIGSIIITLQDVFTFIMILLSTWAINSVVKIVFDEDNYKMFDFVRGIPSAISMTLRILFVSAGVFFAFSAAGFDMKTFSMVLGALGVGIGFGLQNVVNNYISGLILIYERPVQKGDTVEVNNLMGVVKEIGIRASNVRTYDGAEVIIPNANLTNNQVINWTLSDKHKRLDIRVGVSYNSDPNKVLDILKDVADNNAMVAKIPPPMVLFDKFDDSSLNFRLLCWVLLDNGFTTKSELGVAVFKAFEENGISIPFPQVDLHVKDAKNEGQIKEDDQLKNEFKKDDKNE